MGSQWPIAGSSSVSSLSAGSTSDDPLSVFHIGAPVYSGTQARAEQQLCARFADHRGRIDLPALGVLFDHLGGMPFSRVGAESGALTMQARLSMSASGFIDIDDRLTCDADVAMNDEHTGVTPVYIRTATGRLCCLGTARNMRVSRASAASTTVTHRPECPGGHGVLPDPIPAGLSGADILGQIADGSRAAGPLTDLLNGRPVVGSDGGLCFVVGTDPWMGNLFGTMHGGVIATIVGQAFSLAGQLHTPAGGDYHVADMSVGFFRSPSVDGVAVRVDVEAVKVGRRIASFSARMSGHDGTLLCEGVADVHYR